MAGKRDRAVVAVIANLTSSQEAAITADLIKIKNKNAPSGRGIISSCSNDRVGSVLQRSQKRIGN
jgi:hypothetical protein